MAKENRLYPEDQAKVDEFLRKGVNSVERKPFRPLLLLAVLFVIVSGISLFALTMAEMSGLQ